MEQLEKIFELQILNIPVYKWILATLTFLLFIVLRKVVSHLIVKSIRVVVSRTKTRIDDKLLDLVESPLRFLFIVLGIWAFFDILGIKNEFITHLIRSLFIFNIFWLFYNGTYVFKEEIDKFGQRIGGELAKEVSSFVNKTIKAFVIILGLVALLQEWGINVSAFVASMGLGGLAFALAAKDTAANLFGGLSILADKTFKIGDWVLINEKIEGIVEDIGLRTTKIRTFEKSIVTVPNSLIANSPVENFSRRDSRRIKFLVGLTYDTPRETIKKIVKEIKELLENHPGINKNQTLLVNFYEFSDSSLDIFVYCYTNTPDWAKWLEIKEDIQLKIMDIVEKNGSSFAFPSRSIYVEKIPDELKGKLSVND